MKKRTFDCLFIFLVVVGIGGYIFYVDLYRRNIIMSEKTININLNTTDWTRDNIELNIIYNGDKRDIKEYSIDGGKTWSKDNTFIIESNGIYNVYVKNINDKIYKKSLEISNIDKEGPVILIDDNIKVSRYSKVNLNDFVTIYDNGSGVRDSVVYTPSTLNTNVLGEQKIFVYSIDKLANKTIKTITFEVVPTTELVLAKQLELNHKIIIIKNGDTTVLSATITPKYSINKKVNWVSSNPNIVQVDQYGNIKGVNSGEAHITATTSNGISQTCTVIVK